MDERTKTIDSIVRNKGGTWAAVAAAYDAGQAAERERCARIVERINGWTGTREIAAEIRGETNVLRA